MAQEMFCLEEFDGDPAKLIAAVCEKIGINTTYVCIYNQEEELKYDDDNK